MGDLRNYLLSVLSNSFLYPRIYYTYAHPSSLIFTNRNERIWNGRINHHLFINGQCNRAAVNSHFYFCLTDLTRGKGKLKMGKFEFYVLSYWCNSRFWYRTWNMYKRTVVLQVDNLSFPANLSSSEQQEKASKFFGQSICLLISVTGLWCSLQPRYLAIQFILTVKVCHNWIIANKVLSAIRTVTEM